MTGEQILGLSGELSAFLSEFADCFGRTELRKKLAVYVGGQLGDLPRKSVEPIALAAGIAPRNLQEFLNHDLWNEEHLLDDSQRIIARDHADPQAIGIIDESGHPKKGAQTAGVSRQYCGNTGKIDNCVMTVHLTYTSFDSQFRTMIDSELYLPQCWHDDRERCHRAGIPDDVVYRSKYEIALEQLDRARDNGIRLGWITTDEWYGQKPRFVQGLEEREQRFVLEIPRNMAMWLHDPTGRDTPAKPLEDLWRYSRPLMQGAWQRYRIKDTGAGPMVWEVKAAAAWLPRGERVVGPYWVIVARNVLHPDEVKFFLSNASSGVPLSTILHVAFGRWPVERCLQDEKSELGLSHFEVRRYPALRRHLLLTQVSHLFLARQTQRLRGEKSGSDITTGALCGDGVIGCTTIIVERPRGANRASGGAVTVLAASQSSGASQSQQNPSRRVQQSRHSAHRIAPL